MSEPAFAVRVLRRLPDSVLLVAASGRVLAYHPGLAPDGMVRRDAVGHDLADLFPEAVASILTSAIRTALARQEEITTVYALTPGSNGAEHSYLEARMEPSGPDEVLCLVRDITERRLAEQKLVRRELYLAALAQINHRLLASNGLPSPYTRDTLAMLGYAAGATRAYTVDVASPEGAGDSVRNGVFWTAEGSDATSGNVGPVNRLQERVLPGWLPTLRRGRPVQERVDALPEEMQRHLSEVAEGAKVCLLLPILAQDRLVGILGFENHTNDHLWPADEVDLLQAAAAAIAFYIEHDLYTRRFQESAGEVARMNVELTAARDRAEASDRVKSEFLAVMGHEIRTPLNGVISMIEMLLRTPMSEQQHKYADLVHESGLLLLGRINAILDYAEIASGTLELNEVTFSPAAMVEGVAALLKPEAQRKRLSLMTFFHPALPTWAYGDADRLRHVLIALVDNALKFTERGEVIIRIEPVSAEVDHAAARDRIILRFSVSDTGVGLPPDAETWLFTPFTQADTSPTRRYGGAGLGLTTAKRLVEILGGDIGFQSSVQVGSTFWFTAELGESPEGLAHLGRPVGLDGLRVLVIDDVDSTRKILVSYLERWGCQCAAMAGPREGLSALRQALEEGHPYHVALVDMMLPEMDGIAFAAMAAEQGLLDRTKLIAVTAYEAGRREEQVLRAGFCAYLTKPFRQGELSDVLLDTMATWDCAAPTFPASSFVPQPPEVSVGTAHGTLVVVLIDRNTMMRRLAKQELEKQGCAVIAAASDAEALRAVESARELHMVLLDLQEESVAEHDRSRQLELMARVRRIGGGGRTTPLLVGMTTRIGRAAVQICEAAGTDACVTKPLTPGTIRSLLSRLEESR